MIQTITNFLLNHTPLYYWTQSLWRDEAFSVWIAQDSLSEVIRRTSGDFNPPLYYILLHFWMRIFGRSEVTLRGMSVVFFLLSLIVVYLLAKELFKSKFAARTTTLLFAINPMLDYFAFELRMYSLLVFFTLLSMYFLYTKKWRYYVLTTIAGLYTQPFMGFVILAQAFYLLFTQQSRQLLKNSLVIGLLYLPWLPTLHAQLRASGPMWMYPVDLNTVLSILGNLYAGYEGTPGWAWPLMYLVSLLIVLIWIFLFKHVRKSESKKVLQLLTIWVGLPLGFILLISLVKPIYVHRYLIYVSAGMVFLISFFLTQIGKPRAKRTAFIIIAATLVLNLLAQSFHHKVPIRETFATIAPLIKSHDVIYAETPLVYYESLYYAPPTTTVFLYNPHAITPPRYVGEVGMPPKIWATRFPDFPARGFMIQEDGNFRIVSELSRESSAK